MRILHLADVHLDTSFGSRSPRVRERLRWATREAFRRAVDVALDREVDAVIIAGDLFDGTRLSFETEQFLVVELGRLDERAIPVVYATGNHDPGVGRRRRLAWPGCVTVVADPTPRRVAVRGSAGEVVGWITAAGHSSSRETRDLAAAFPRPEGGLPEVAVLHTQVVGSRGTENHDPYAPTTLETLADAGYDYWALGHVHLRQSLCELPAVHYPGNPQGRTLRESGPKGVLVAEVARGFASQVGFVPVAPVRWEDLVVDRLPDSATGDALVRRIEERWAEARREDPDPDREWMVRVRLSGATPLWKELTSAEERSHLARELETRLDALEVTVWHEGFHAPVDLGEHRDRDDVLGVALGLVEGVRKGEVELPGLDVELAGVSDAELQDYLASILDGAEGELATRLLEPPGV
jgi:DNA repair exonuclease SbcCD nuclease subunit